MSVVSFVGEEMLIFTVAQSVIFAHSHCTESLMHDSEELDLSDCNWQGRHLCLRAALEKEFDHADGAVCLRSQLFQHLAGIVPHVDRHSSVCNSCWPLLLHAASLVRDRHSAGEASASGL